MNAPLDMRFIRHGDSASKTRLDMARRSLPKAFQTRYDQIVGCCDRKGWGLDKDGRIDAQTMVFATRQLEQILTEVLDEEFPELAMAEGKIVPIDSQVKDGLPFFIYYIHTGGGLARFASGYSTEYPMSHIENAEVSGRVQLIKGGYEFSDEDMVTAQAVGEPIEPRLLGHARRAHMKLMHTTGLWGREDIGLPGFITHPNIQVSDAADNGSGSTFWEDKTADQILADVNTIVNDTRSLTFDIENPNRILLPLEEMTLVATTRLGGDNGTIFIMELLQKAHPGVSFIMLQDLAATKSDGNLTEDAIFSYRFDKKKAALVVPRPFTIGRTIETLDMIQTPATSKIGGIKMPVPLMCHRMDGVGNN